MESWEKFVASLVGIGAGSVGLWGAVHYAQAEAGRHVHNDVRNSVNDSCGVQLNDQQWRQLLGTNEWSKYRSTLPSIPWYENTKLVGPILMSSTSSFLASKSMEWGASVFADLDGLKGWLAYGFAALLIGAAQLLFFGEAVKRFVVVDGLSRSDPLCATARQIADGHAQARITGAAIYDRPQTMAAALLMPQPAQAAYSVFNMPVVRPSVSVAAPQPTPLLPSVLMSRTLAH